MEDRLVQLLQAEGINPTRFAERIGVQRSSISHILSGRNKPSYDFIVKILESFPTVNPDWLLRGKGLMYKNDIPIQPSLFDTVRTTDIDSAKSILVKEHIQNSNSENTEFIKKDIIGHVIQDEKTNALSLGIRKIEKIVIFYFDRSFSEYHPNS